MAKLSEAELEKAVHEVVGGRVPFVEWEQVLEADEAAGNRRPVPVWGQPIPEHDVTPLWGLTAKQYDDLIMFALECHMESVPNGGLAMYCCVCGVSISVEQYERCPESLYCEEHFPSDTMTEDFEVTGEETKND